MKKRLAKGLAYAAFPKATFTAMNPGKAAFGKAASWAMEHAQPARRRRNRTRSAVAGLGAAAVAIPVGMWLGRKMWNQDDRGAGRSHLA